MYHEIQIFCNPLLQILYKLVEGMEFFMVGNASGDLSLSKELDREKKTEFKVILKAADNGTPSMHSNVKVRPVS